MRVDTVWRGGNVLTLDPARPRASALAVLGDRIVAVGDDVDLDGLTADRTVELGGATVVPGFHDAHDHCVFFGMSLAELPLSTPPVQRLADVYDAVAAAARDLPAGSWIVGAGYDQNRLAERRHPSAQELDAVVPGHRVRLRHTSGHMAVVNGAVLAEIGIDAAEVPAGGQVERDGTGRPTGLLLETAQSLVRDLVYPYSLDDITGAIDRATRQYLTEGITSAQEAGIGAGLVAWSPRELAAYASARASGRLHVRTTLMVAADALHETGGSADDLTTFGLDLGIATGLGDETLRIGPLKIFSDGSMLGRTAAMKAPFADDPGNAGFLQRDPDELRELVRRAHRGGWQIATHAIGDLAVATALDCYEHALRDLPRSDHRHRIEHCGVVGDDDLDRIARLGVVPVPQGRFVTSSATGWRRRSARARAAVLPPAQLPRPGHPAARQLGPPGRAGCARCSASPTSCCAAPASGAEFAPDEALTPMQALHAWTLGSAYAAFEEHRKGSLVPGKLADLAVLSDDLTAVDPEQIASLQVLATVVGGEVRHDVGLG
jgi:predicted amidohydrolase YtcJ